ncbi:uncharacterized protein [Eleutherodactylus coqui]|uniref:uncharacterized protein n=1 Tax=Eleutherodactylus coqui TaxID=57060 RepID=UPI00346286DA
MSGALLLGLLWGLSHGSLAQYCVEQPYEKESFTGESITVPCSFTYRENISPLSVSLVVRAGSGHLCLTGDGEIHNSTTNHTIPKYDGRLSVQLDPAARTSSFTIKNLTGLDSQMYCCRYSISLPKDSSTAWEYWQLTEGTRISVKGEKEMILEQESLILAFPGETVTIAARFALKNQTTTPNVTECRVFMSTADRWCGNQMYLATCTQRRDDNLVFVKINNTDNIHNGFYCYSIHVFGGGYKYTGRRTIGSQLLVLERSRATTINQTTEVEMRGPVRISCNFSVEDMIRTFSVGDRSVLWTQVYWMFGEPREHFVYHPNTDYIHPDYKGKTKLIGQSDLLLQDFRGPDNTTLFCRVAVRFCSPVGRPNTITTILGEGPGTLLRVLDLIDSPESVENDQVLIAVIYVGVKNLICLLLVILSLLYLKKRSHRPDEEYEVNT